ncbi:MAG TPA: tripartite tricarboxylate transporter substrate-binding protein [Xanthobacteraceae bacterium]|jgi:tripartite-type tricarboxylate transporter receptor subunit TctC
MGFMRGLSASALFVLVMSGAPAAAQYPSKPITIIVPFAAGGPTDVVARLLGDHMSRTLGQTIIVEDVGGAGGTIGMTRAAQANPDGYTIALGNTGTQAAAPALYPHLKYDPAKSFAQIGIANFTPQAIVAKKSTLAATLKEFIEYLKANSEKLTYGHAGVGSVSHVSGLLFDHEFGLKPTLVPYRGTGPALQALVAGQLDYMIDQSLNVIPQVKAGTIKSYAIAAPERLSALPDVPTTREAGVDFVFRAWNAMVAPKGTPNEIVGRLAEALSKALDDPNVQKRYVELGSSAPTADERGPAGLQKLVESEVARITPVIKAAGVTAE